MTSNSDEVPQDRYCRPNVTIDDYSAFYVELEPLEDMRYQFMLWDCDKPPKGFRHDHPRTRDPRARGYRCLSGVQAGGDFPSKRSDCPELSIAKLLMKET
jgi:hypothetical protein